MGFRSNSFATVWGDVRSVSNTLTRARISVSRKDKQTGEYVQDFGGFVAFVGTACAQKALKLHERDRIKLGDVDVTNRYDKTSGKEYTNFNVYSFETADAPGESRQSNIGVDDGEMDDDLPF